MYSMTCPEPPLCGDMDIESSGIISVPHAFSILTLSHLNGEKCSLMNSWSLSWDILWVGTGGLGTSERDVGVLVMVLVLFLVAVFVRVLVFVLVFVLVLVGLLVLSVR